MRSTRLASVCSPVFPNNFSPVNSYTFSSVSASLFPFFSLPQIIIPPESPVPVRKVLPPISPSTPRRPPVVEEPKQPLPVQRPPVPIPPPPPPPPPPPSPPHQPRHILEPVAPIRQIIKPFPPPATIQEPLAPKPEPHLPVLETPIRPPPVEPVTPVLPKVLVSVGCQTEYDPIFPSMQA